VTSIGRDGAILAMVVGSFTSVSLAPPLVAFLPAHSSTTWPRIQESGRFCVNVLAHDQSDLCRKIAAKAPDSLQGIALRRSPNRMPIISGVVAWIDCTLHSAAPAGDHDIVLGRVEELQVETGKHPLIFLKGQYAEMPLPAAS
jgi:flavin reductase (DIM6/NTAB) family NADH-FMN oxidoreductase RutF